MDAIMLLMAVFLVAVPSVWARKCYVCDSQTQPGCADANQISQLYTDCSGGGYGGGYNQYQQPGGAIGQPGFVNQAGLAPQQLGQQGQYGGVGGGYGGGDRCVKTMIVGQGQMGQPRVIRSCGTIGLGGVSGDGCFWNQNVMTCSCNWNYCNGSSRLSSVSVTALLVAGVATVLSHLYRSSL